MDLSQIAASIPVYSGKPVRVENGAGRRIAVLQGKVWITQDRDPRDVVLVTGDDFVLDRAGLAVITALDGDARVTA